jgi:transposase InsO family protein
MMNHSTVFQAVGVRVVRSAVQEPRMNSIMERWVGSCRRELLDRTLIWNQRYLMSVLREYEDFYNTHRPHCALNQAAPLSGTIAAFGPGRVVRRGAAGPAQGYPHQRPAARAVHPPGCARGIAL